MKLSQREGKARGFTLIELLVVISIISLLSSIVMAALTKVRTNARDSARIQTLIQLRTALESYRDANNTYPITTATPVTSPKWNGNVNGCPFTASWFVYSAALIPGLVPTYYSVEPHDSKENGPLCQEYLYESDGVDYKIMAYGMVEKGLISVGQPFARFSSICAGGAEATYAVYSHNRSTYAAGYDPACW
jgi:prepilin-type N-terminal cleavage/methylation domain-containing protein